jgi:hypothetical protein
VALTATSVGLRRPLPRDPGPPGLRITPLKPAR